jgi:hypothetical protein
LIDTTNGVPPTAAGLLACIEGACDWEVNCRAGLDYPLQPPEAAIPPAKDAISIDAAMAMRATFVQDSRAVLALFDALVEHDDFLDATSRIFDMNPRPPEIYNERDLEPECFADGV